MRHQKPLIAAPWYGPDRHLLTHTGMMEFAAKLSLYLSYQVRADNPSVDVSFEVLAADDPLAASYKASHVYFHGVDDSITAYIVKWRSFRGSGKMLRRDFTSQMKAGAIRFVGGKFPAQAAALKVGCSLVTTQDRDWNSAVPPALRDRPEAPNGRSLLGMCAVFRSFVKWPDSLVEELAAGGLRFMPQNSQPGHEFKTDWSDKTSEQQQWLRESYYTPASVFDGDGVFTEFNTHLVCCLVTRDPENPSANYGVIGLDPTAQILAGLWVDEGELSIEWSGEEELLAAIDYEPGPLPFKVEHIEALSAALAVAKKSGFKHPSAIRIIEDVAKRTTTTIVWPKPEEVRSMIPRASKLFRTGGG
jgi:hypothetical protein